MKQLLAPANATFSASGKTITFATTIPSTISHILHVTNVTRGVLYFQPQAGAAFTGAYASPVLTLVCSTSGHADADKLEIFYDDALTTKAVTQSGTWTVQPGNTANTTAWKVDGSAVTQPVSATSLPLPSGAATESTLGGVLTTSDFDTKTGALTETAPATDTASSGLNGRLQRIAQRITSLITALGSPFQAGGSIGNTTFASTQSGTWTVQPGNTANTTAWKVDGSAVTQPVSLPATARTSASSIVTTSGSVTAGKQSVQFVPSSDFTGTLLSAAWPGTNAPIGFSVTGPETIDAIAYTVTAGSLTILTLT
jgi:hypothetical protein